MKISFAVIDSATGNFMKNPSSDTDLVDSRDEATAFRDLLSETEPGDFRVIRVKIF
ncbi:hypothetical protein ACFQGT_09770 [Natrialbaceae archaeon GCM10025810]|uniref:hypothetical protein n=1 Tax=Halovalidus salilacus TaxID=3075124 RepID=UPI00360F2B25